MCAYISKCNGGAKERVHVVGVCVVRRGEYEKKKLNKSVNMSKRQ